MAHSGEADVSRGCRQEGAGPQRGGRVVSRAAVGGVYPARHRRNPSSRVSRRRSASAPVSAIRRGRSRFWGPRVFMRTDCDPSGQLYGERGE